MAEMEDDQDTVDAVISDLETATAGVEKLEFQRMFAGEMDPNNAFLDIQSGSGGTSKWPITTSKQSDGYEAIESKIV